MDKMKYVIDLDGTIYKNKVVFDEAIKFIDYLNQNNREYVFLTNCPEKTPDELFNILNNIGIKTKLENIITAGIIAMEYLNKTAKGKKVYVVGSQSYKDFLIKNGIILIDNTDEIADVVLIAFDTHITYNMLRDANYHILNGATFLATNDDESIPTLTGPIPHTGALVKAVETSSKKNALILGKPSKICFDILCETLDANKENLCMIGDRLDTDMLFAKNNGFSGYLMLTGLTNSKIMLENKLLFTKVFNNLLEVIDYDKLNTIK